MVFKQEITVDQDIFDAIEQGAGKLPVLMDTAFKRNVSRLSSRTVAKLREEPPPSRPGTFRRHATPEQKKAVMAKLRKANNIPYQRTGRYAAVWASNIETTPDGGIFTISNPATIKGKGRWAGTPLENVIQGVLQQGFHKETGWIPSQDILADALVEAEDVLIETWFTVTDGIIT